MRYPHVIVAGLLALPWALQAQEAPRALDLQTLQDAAVRHDPRAQQASLLRAQSALRLANITAEARPTLALEGQAQYQSDVAAVPIVLPGGTAPDAPPHDTYDARMVARQRLIDPARAPRVAVERAQLAEQEARLGTSLYALRAAVNDAYFGALLLAAQERETRTLVADLEAQHALVTRLVRSGAALPGDAAMLQAEILRRRQAIARLQSDRAAALDVLARLTGVTLTTQDSLALPPGTDMAMPPAGADTLRRRPEHAQFARARELLARQGAVVDAQRRPRLSAFARTGYGRPGLNPLASAFDAYWLAGVQVEWAPWNWGSTDRERELLALQRRIVETEEAAFAEGVQRRIVADQAAIERLQAALVTDDAIIALREQVLRETRVRHREGVITSAEYVDRQTDLAEARLARARHVIELAQARARILTELGLEVHE